MAMYKTVVNALLTQWSYHSLVLSQEFEIIADWRKNYEENVSNFVVSIASAYGLQF